MLEKTKDKKMLLSCLVFRQNNRRRIEHPDPYRGGGHDGVPRSVGGSADRRGEGEVPGTAEGGGGGEVPVHHAGLQDHRRAGGPSRPLERWVHQFFNICRSLCNISN